jgi:hypothetical protein
VPFERGEEEVDEKCVHDDEEGEEGEWLPDTEDASGDSANSVSAAAASASSSLSARPVRQQALKLTNCFEAMRAFEQLSEDEKEAVEDWLLETGYTDHDNSSDSASSSDSSSSSTSASFSDREVSSADSEPELLTESFFQVIDC